MIIPLVAITLGFFVGFFIPYEIPQNLSPYVAIAVLACLDSILGGIRSNLDGKFKFGIFFSGFFGNAIIAVLLVLMGEKLLGISLQVAVIVLYGTRLFKNFADIRRHLLSKKNEVIQETENFN